MRRFVTAALVFVAVVVGRGPVGTDGARCSHGIAEAAERTVFLYPFGEHRR
jgi:hypothetical protein